MKKVTNMRPNSNQKIVRLRSRRNKSVIVNKARVINQNSPKSSEEELNESPKIVLGKLKLNSQMRIEE